MTISEKARQIAENYAECEWDACNEAALEMAEWLIKNLYREIENKKVAMPLYGGWVSAVEMKEINAIFHVDGQISLDQALKTVGDALFPQK